MARIRTIKPEFWESEKLGRLSDLARLNFLGLISLADDSGRGRGALDWLSGRLHPYSPKNRGRLMEHSLRELETAGVVLFYEVAGCKYYFIKGFPEHQRINRPTESRIPPPPLIEDSPPPQGGLMRSSKREGIKDQGRDQGEEHAGGFTEQARRFAPPSLAEALGYWKERSLNGDPESFLDYYASKGWKVGHEGMKNWKAAARNWSRREVSKRNQPTGKTASFERYLAANAERLKTP